MDKVAAVYANALVDLAQGKNALDTVHADVDSLQVSEDHIAHKSMRLPSHLSGPDGSACRCSANADWGRNTNRKQAKLYGSVCQSQRRSKVGVS